jgi:2-(1,2-epoxy-1,2-dihydrophenyl)acetyl-CoA isomerase
MDKLLAAHGISPEGQIDRIFRWEELDFVRAMNAMRDFIEAVRDLEAFVVITLSGRMILPLIGPMLACDYRVASEDFVLINRMTDYAIAPIGGLPWFLTRAVGLKKAEELIREPGEVPGAKAMELGLIEHLAPAEKLLETAVAMAREMAARPEGSKNTLKLASTIGEESLEHYFEREEKMFRKSIARLLAWNGSE